MYEYLFRKILESLNKCEKVRKTDSFIVKTFVEYFLTQKKLFIKVNIVCKVQTFKLHCIKRCSVSVRHLAKRRKSKLFHD